MSSNYTLVLQTLYKSLIGLPFQAIRKLIKYSIGKTNNGNYGKRYQSLMFATDQKNN